MKVLRDVWKTQSSKMIRLLWWMDVNCGPHGPYGSTMS